MFINIDFAVKMVVLTKLYSSYVITFLDVKRTRIAKVVYLHAYMTLLHHLILENLLLSIMYGSKTCNDKNNLKTLYNNSVYKGKLGR